MDAATANPRIATQPPASPERQERTQLAGTGKSSVTADTTDNPVVGWLVVVAGPGRGQARAIGYGMNAIGRGADQRISLDFGDEQISRSNHAALTYDPRSRKFFVQHGGGANLTYLDGQAVLAPAPIESGSDIIIGRTTLRFVALCGPQFDWQDE
jgi:prepilin-type processing-associated H-X9-DG protein